MVRAYSASVQCFKPIFSLLRMVASSLFCACDPRMRLAFRIRYGSRRNCIGLSQDQKLIRTWIFLSKQLGCVSKPTWLCRIDFARRFVQRAGAIGDSARDSRFGPRTRQCIIYENPQRKRYATISKPVIRHGRCTNPSWLKFIGLEIKWQSHTAQIPAKRWNGINGRQTGRIGDRDGRWGG